MLKNLKLNYVDDIKEGKEDSLWYGGRVVEIEYNDVTFTIGAYGNVEGTIYKDGETLVRFKDRCNTSSFETILDDYLKGELKNDLDLNKWITRDFVTKETLAENPNVIYLDYGNCWEVYAEKDGDTIDIPYDIYETKISDVIKEVSEMIPELYNDYILDCNA